MKNVKFSDDKNTAVIAVFVCPQSPEEYSNQGEVEDDDKRLLVYIDSLPESFRQSVVNM